VQAAAAVLISGLNALPLGAAFTHAVTPIVSQVLNQEAGPPAPGMPSETETGWTGGRSVWEQEGHHPAGGSNGAGGIDSTNTSSPQPPPSSFASSSPYAQEWDPGVGYGQDTRADSSDDTLRGPGPGHGHTAGKCKPYAHRASDSDAAISRPADRLKAMATEMPPL
jgi:hypothetical protein